MPDIAAHLKQRDTDHSFAARVNYWFALRGFVIWAITVVVTVTVFIVRLMDLPDRVARIEAEHTNMVKTLSAVAKLQCFNPIYTTEQLYLVEIDCRGLRSTIPFNGDTP